MHRVALALVLASPAVVPAGAAQGVESSVARASARGPARAEPARASRQAQRLDGIAAVVNERVVLDSDIDELLEADPRANALIESIDAGTPEDRVMIMLAELREQALEVLIQRRLVIDEGERLGVKVTEDQVDAYIKQIANAEHGGSEAALRRWVETSGAFSSWNDYRVSLKEDILYYITVNSLISYSVSEAQVREHYRKMTRGEDERVDVFAFEIKPRTTNQADRDDALQRATILVRRLNEGFDPADLASELGLPTSPVSIARGQVAPKIEEALFVAKVGAIVGPLPSGQGYRVYSVMDHTASEILPYEQAKEKIREELMETAHERAEAKLIEQLKAHAHIELR